MGKLYPICIPILSDGMYCKYLIVCVCVFRWNLPGPDNYALQYADGVQTYITESVSHICTQINISVYIQQRG